MSRIIIPKKGETTRWIEPIVVDGDIGKYANKEPVNQPRTVVQGQDDGQYVFVPETGIYVSKGRLYLGKNWYDAHKALDDNGQRMMTIPEFISFLNHIRKSGDSEHKAIYDDITKVGGSYRAEWLDADFKLVGDELYLNFEHFIGSDGKPTPNKREKLDPSTLMKDKTPGISLENYLDSQNTSQGLPVENIGIGDLWYWFPRSDNNSVARFDADSGRADLNCGWNPTDSGDSLGVRAVRRGAR